MRKRQPEIVSEKLEYIAQTIDNDINLSNIDNVTSLVQEKILADNDNTNWLI
jgi:hypothetical protein